MKTILRISLILNLVLLGSLIVILSSQRKQAVAPLPVLSKSKPPRQAAAPLPPTTPESKPAPFRWSQLEAARSYRAYIANLRAIGCPEPTIEDIVRGDADRAFSWERNQLHLDGASTGPWSRAREMQLVASLLGAHVSEETAALARSTEPRRNTNSGGDVAQTSVPSPGEVTGSPSYPLFLQNANWHAMGFTADQQAVIAQVRRQFERATANLNQNSSRVAGRNPDVASLDGASSSPSGTDSAALTRWQKALQDANNQLRDLLGAQAYMAYEQQQYYKWYKPQVIADTEGGKPLIINPDAFSLK